MVWGWLVSGKDTVPVQAESVFGFYKIKQSKARFALFLRTIIVMALAISALDIPIWTGEF